MQAVQPGTNGGVSSMGTAAGLAGGLFMGAAFWVLESLEPRTAGMGALGWRAVPLGLAAGGWGNILDSLLGATLQCAAAAIP